MYLDATPEETLITDTFDMGKIDNDITGTHKDRRLSELVARITARPVDIPSTPCGEKCDGTVRECLLRQSCLMKDNVEGPTCRFSRVAAR